VIKQSALGSVLKKVKFLKYGLLVVLGLIITATLGISAYIYVRTSDNYGDSFVLNAPYGPVAINLDQYGVPTITSEKNDLDVYFAQGFMHAKDRLWQMELQRHIVRGQLSEIFGEATIEHDKYLRTWGFYRSAAHDWAGFDDQTKAIINAYTAGVNAYIDTKKLPLQFIILNHKPQPWTNYDSFIWSKMVAWQLQNSWQDKIENYLLTQKYGAEKLAILRPPYPKDAPTVINSKNMISGQIPIVGVQATQSISSTSDNLNASLLAFEEINTKIRQLLNINNVPGKGSNNLVIAGKLTKTGKPLLSNDIHLDLAAPVIWYLVNLRGPNVHVTGATLTGTSNVAIGHNDNIAWGMTNAGVDVQDVYLIPKASPIQTIEETINVKGGDPVSFAVKMSAVGPIINDIIGATELEDYLSVRWVALENSDTTIQSFIKMNYAQNWRQFTEALKDFVAPAQNVVYADTSGNIGYYLPGLVPVRKNWSGQYPVALDQKHQWSGYIPFDNLPHTYNPPEGFIASANNKIIDDTYPYSLTYNWLEAPYRINRILDLIKDNKTVDMDDIKTLQYDTHDYFAKDLLPLLLRTKPLDLVSAESLKILESWDGNMATDSIGATIFGFWIQDIKQLQPDPIVKLLNLSRPLFIIEQLRSDGEFCHTTTSSNCHEFLSITLQQATKRITAKLGPLQDNWRWGKVHKALFKDTTFGDIKALSWIWNRTVPSGGNAYTINVGPYNRDFFQVAGANYRQIIDLNNFSSSVYVLAMGQSEKPWSRHYDDQLGLWRDGQYIKVVP